MGENLQKVLTRAVKGGWRFRTKKFKVSNKLTFGRFFLKTSTVGDVTISPNPARLEAGNVLKTPNNRNDFQSVLGFL